MELVNERILKFGKKVGWDRRKKLNQIIYLSKTLYMYFMYVSVHWTSTLRY